MKLAWIACAGLLLFAGGATAQDGGKAMTKTTIGTQISLGTATPGGGFPVYGNAGLGAENRLSSGPVLAYNLSRVIRH